MLRFTIIFITIVSAWFILPEVNRRIDRKYRLSDGAHVFIMGRLLETGILDKYLAENCKTGPDSVNNCSLCAYKDSLPPTAIDFIWQDKGAFYKTGSWKGTKEEYNKIINYTLTHPAYIKMHIVKAIEATFRQLVHNDVGNGIDVYGRYTAPYIHIEKHLPHEIPEFNASLQNNGEWKPLLISINRRYNFVLILSLLLILGFYATRKIVRINLNPQLLLLGKLFFLFIICNAFVTGAFANVLDRLGSRIIWILPLFALILILESLTLFSRKETVSKENP
jgi:hypothetical protein